MGKRISCPVKRDSFPNKCFGKKKLNLDLYVPAYVN
jgi:hypothetical protein